MNRKSLLVILLLSIFLACPNKDKKEETAKTTLIFWEKDTELQEFYTKEIEEFTKLHPEIEVKRSHYKNEELRKNFFSSVIGGGGPDVVSGPNDNLGIFVPGKLIIPITELFDPAFLSQFDENALEASDYNGKLYMLPMRVGNELLLTYNKKFVQEAPKTFDELIDIAKKLKKEKKVEYGLVFDKTEPYYIVPFLAAFGGKIFHDERAENPKPSLDSTAVAEWMKFIKQLHNDGIIPKEVDKEIAKSLFQNGKAAFIIDGPWVFAEYKRAKIDFGIAAIPPINGNYPRPYFATKGFSISRNVQSQKKKEVVKKFLEFMSSAESQLRAFDSHGEMPTHKSAMSNSKVVEDPFIQGQKEQLVHCLPMPVVTEMRAIWDAIRPVQQKVFAGLITPEEAPELMQERALVGIKALQGSRATKDNG